MAPIKFEEHLKEKLEKRSIQPSAETWKSLANRLDQHDKQQNRRTFWWLGIAASVVGIALVATLIFSGSESRSIEPTVVDTKDTEEIKSNTLASENLEVPKEETKSDSKQDMKASTEENPIPKAKRIPKEEMILKEAVASSDLTVQEPIQNILDTPETTADFEQSKLEEVVAEIQKINTENQGVAEAEIDSLLKQAERELLTDRIYNENSKTVDANALLQDVEEELEQSFRTKVYEALKNSYVTVKTAVAERNN